jgi:hypothetical protein
MAVTTLGRHAVKETGAGQDERDQRPGPTVAESIHTGNPTALPIDALKDT